MMEEVKPPIPDRERAGQCIRAVVEGRLHTAGEWMDWIRQMKKISPWLRKWVLKNVRKHLSDSSVEYLKTFMEW